MVHNVCNSARVLFRREVNLACQADLAQLGFGQLIKYLCLVWYVICNIAKVIELERNRQCRLGHIEDARSNRDPVHFYQ
jgi:hypothetical protein